MPVKAKKIKGKWRIVDPDGVITKNRAGTAVDGGGHASMEAAMHQVNAINMQMHGSK